MLAACAAALVVAFVVRAVVVHLIDAEVDAIDALPLLGDRGHAAIVAIEHERLLLSASRIVHVALSATALVALIIIARRLTSRRALAWSAVVVQAGCAVIPLVTFLHPTGPMTMLAMLLGALALGGTTSSAARGAVGLVAVNALVWALYVLTASRGAASVLPWLDFTAAVAVALAIKSSG